MTSSRPYIARAFYDWILENDCTPHILVDATRNGVEVPGEFVKDGQIVLNISPTAVRALHMGNDVVTFDGRFGGEALTIVVPLDALMAIYARENGQGMVFEVESYSEADEQQEEFGEELPGLTAVPTASDSSSTSTEDDEPPKPPRNTGRPSLKVVK
ncbi:ClpXP protease specificity-enhancing factor [Endozoicomonas sp. OPT23]|nr:ClpXP protease specificity-enhancing factor [Endozoicomonas sp. OPT23]MRI35398.1 ClpXP protease specificity-enhancing factor [Endozoicomonas sp. OPT23]